SRSRRVGTVRIIQPPRARSHIPQLEENLTWKLPLHPEIPLHHVRQRKLARKTDYRRTDYTIRIERVTRKAFAQNDERIDLVTDIVSAHKKWRIVAQSRGGAKILIPAVECAESSAHYGPRCRLISKPEPRREIVEVGIHQSASQAAPSAIRS